MQFLALKIPPLIVLFICAGLMSVIDTLFPQQLLSINISLSLLGIVMFIGCIIILTGVFTFKKAQTTVNPTNPESTSSLMTIGIYKKTRNPMYVGMACCLLSWALWLSNPLTLTFVIGFIFYIDRFQIKPEEQALTKLFQQDYLNYLKETPRWL